MNIMPQDSYNVPRLSELGAWVIKYINGPKTVLAQAKCSFKTFFEEITECDHDHDFE